VFPSSLGVFLNLLCKNWQPQSYFSFTLIKAGPLAFKKKTGQRYMAEGTPDPAERCAAVDLLSLMEKYFRCFQIK
jgi:hypothetical protein